MLFRVIYFNKSRSPGTQSSHAALLHFFQCCCTPRVSVSFTLLYFNHTEKERKTFSRLHICFLDRTNTACDENLWADLTRGNRLRQNRHKEMMRKGQASSLPSTNPPTRAVLAVVLLTQHTNAIKKGLGGLGLKIRPLVSYFQRMYQSCRSPHT